jgi:hypothetical protein
MNHQSFRNDLSDYVQSGQPLLRGVLPQRGITGRASSSLLLQSLLIRPSLRYRF